MPFELPNLDFASLRTLRLVHELGSFSRAAETLGLAQSTVSYTLARLREAFDDPLFVRQGQGIVPTTRCSEIVAQAGELLDRFEELAAPRDFEPAVASLEIGISCNYYERVTILPQIVRVLRCEAPGIRLKVISSTVQGKGQLTRSQSDILLGAVQIQEAGYFRRSLFKEDYVCIMDPQNPLAQAPLDLESFVRAPQVIVNYGDGYRARFLVEMETAGYQPNTAMEVPSPASMDRILLGTDLIATVPRRIAQTYQGDVASVACPVSAEIPIDMFWTARTHSSAPHVWLRSLIATVSGREAESLQDARSSDTEDTHAFPDQSF
ncbi:LysR family transcriptional regulator [Aliiruegeria sabulilitoris]|uniref:LysR family transcriptional regulator n=1 Tax=Aliiruegeria sabulilitoris TaxID=1510458 RepID=UPI0008349486|nr:LysR family transcriptional regulator [Aliiruegeria sabulilitoris]NDR56332.1 LysR family transcriptional regulator [Pseudoruegeria sp. M32A2M]